MEAIQFFYSYNTFEIRDPDVIVYLSRLLLPDRLNAITSVNFNWNLGAPASFPHPDRQSINPELMKRAKERDHEYRQIWKKAWKCLSSMEHLNDLRVKLDIAQKQVPFWDVEELEIVKSVSRPKKFDLLLPSSMAERVKGCIVLPNLHIGEY